MGWPPQVGELLPRAEEAFEVRKKLIGYSLDRNHPDGGWKAHGFGSILGITVDHVDHLEREIRIGIRRTPITSVSLSAHGIKCVVEFPVRGVADLKARQVNLRTVWQFSDPCARPRLLTAFLKP
jgi:hypothetical protein